MKGLEKELPNENYQYEFPYLSLSSKDFDGKLSVVLHFMVNYDTSQGLKYLKRKSNQRST